MRCLTVRQPWAALIMHGGKNIENRSRNIVGSYRGAVAIHAALAYDMSGFAAFPRMANAPEARIVGAIVGVVDIIGVHRAGDRCDRCEPWGEYGVHHIELARPRPLPEPIPCRGFLGLWTPPDHIIEQLQEVTQ